MQFFKNLILISVIVLAPRGLQAEDSEGYKERWDRCVFMVTKKKLTEEQKNQKAHDTVFASGFFVTHNKRLFLVTAKHAAEDTQPDTRILYRRRKGDARWLAIAKLMKGIDDKSDITKNLSRGNPWKYHPKADLAVLECHIEKKEDADKIELTQMAIPLDSAIITELKRTTEIDITGFPNAIGTQGGSISALVMKGHLCSRETAHPGKWGLQKLFFAVPTVAGGTSGGPVFLSHEDAAKTELVGMYVGYIYDKSGSQLSQIVPARYVKELVEEMCKPRIQKLQLSKQ